MRTQLVVLGLGALAIAGWLSAAHAEEEKSRAHAVADIAKVEGSNAYWIQGEVSVKLPAGWAIDDDTGKKDTDIRFENAKDHLWASMTEADVADAGAYAAKLSEGLQGAGKDGKEESKAAKTVDGNAGQQLVISVTAGDAKLKYLLTVFGKGGKSYALVAFTAAELFDGARKDFDALVDSVKFGKAGGGAGGGAEQAALQGQWLVTSMTVDGKDAPPEAIKDMVLTVTGEQYKLAQGPNEAESGKLKFGEEKGAKTLDWLIESGNDKGKVQHSIYKLDGDAFSFAAAQPGKDERPTEIGTKAGQAYVVLKKKK